MKKHIAAVFVFFLAGLVNLPAQIGGTKDLAAVVMGIRFALEFAEKSGDESGGNPDASLTWEYTGTHGETLRLNFADFRYTLWNNEGRTHFITLNGHLDMDDFLLNGTLEVRGDVSLSTLAFQGFDPDGGPEGKITADGRPCTNGELEHIFEDEVFYNHSAVITWELETFLTCALAFIAADGLEWDTGENVLESLFYQENRPQPGSSASNPENTMRTVSRPEGIKFTYEKFPVIAPKDSPGDIDVLFAVITGEILLRLKGQSPAALFFDGTVDLEEIEGVSHIQFKQCFLTPEFSRGEIGGTVVVDRREFPLAALISYINAALE
jgi:hypothetical protein